MISKALEAQITLNDKLVPLINSDFNIDIDWDISITQKDNGVLLDILCNSLKGYFQYIEKRDSYKKETRISFESDNTWVINHEKDNSFMSQITNSMLIEPYLVIVNLDTKKVVIKF
jgi:hypothetical protein